MKWNDSLWSILPGEAGEILLDFYLPSDRLRQQDLKSEQTDKNGSVFWKLRFSRSYLENQQNLKEESNFINLNLRWFFQE